MSAKTAYNNNTLNNKIHSMNVITGDATPVTIHDITVC